MIAKLALTMLALSAAAPAAAQDRVWGASDAWQVRLSRAGCDFAYAPDGAAGAVIVMELGMWITVSSTTLAERGSHHSRSRVTLAGVEAHRDPTENGRGSIYARTENPAALLAGKSLRVSPALPGGKDMDFPLPATALPEADYATCLTEYDRAQRGSDKPAVIQPRLRLPFDIFILPGDYPRWAGRLHLRSQIRMRMTVSAFAGALDCTTLVTTGNIVLDGVTCNLFKRRARFIAATDAEGQPTIGSVDIDFDWALVRHRKPSPAL